MDWKSTLRNPNQDQLLFFKIRRQYGTMQNLIARPSNSYINTTGCQHKSLPQFLLELVAAIQLKCIHQARNFCQHRWLRIHISGGNRNHVFFRIGYSRSRTSRGGGGGASITFSWFLSNSFLGSGLLSKSNNRQPGVSRRSCWLWAKKRCPWKCRIVSYPPWVRIDTSFGHILQ